MKVSSSVQNTLSSCFAASKELKLLSSRPHFKEFVVNFDRTGKTVKQINKALLNKKIFGGKNLSKEFPELGQSALYCVTEIHTQDGSS